MIGFADYRKLGSSPSPGMATFREISKLQSVTNVLTTLSWLPLGRYAAWRPSSNPHDEPEWHATTNSSRMHDANNRLVDTTTIAPRPPSSLTTELEPCIQSPRNATATQQQNAKCHQRLDDTTTIAPRPPSSLTTELELRYEARDTQPQHSNSNHSATNNFDDSTTFAPRPPNSDNPCDTTKQL